MRLALCGLVSSGLDVKRRDTISVQGRASLCKSPHHNSLVRVKVIYPSVTVGEPGAVSN